MLSLHDALPSLGADSAPHGVIQGPDGAAWITDGGQNAIVRYDPKTEKIDVWKLPEGAGYTNLNTGAFDGDGIHWFTGQNGIYGRRSEEHTSELQSLMRITYAVFCLNKNT